MTTSKMAKRGRSKLAKNPLKIAKRHPSKMAKAKRHSKVQRRLRKRKRSATGHRYSGKFGDGCGINSILDGADTNSACYKPCDLTEKSYDLYCQHIGFSAGGQYTKQSADGKNHYRPRDFEPRKSTPTAKETASDAEYEKAFEALAKKNNWKDYVTTNMNTNIDLTKAAKNLAKGVAAATVGAAGLLVDGVACAASKGSNCNLKATEFILGGNTPSFDDISVSKRKTAAPAPAPAQPDTPPHVHTPSEPETPKSHSPNVELIVAAEHMLHMPTTPTVHMTPDQAKDEKHLESHNISEILPIFEQDEEFKSELKPEDPALYAKLDQMVKDKTPQLTALQKAQARKAAAPATAPASAPIPAHTPAPEPAHPPATPAPASASAPVPAHTPAPETAHPPATPAPATKAKGKNALTPEQAAQKRADYCKQNPNDKTVPKDGTSCADFCAKPDSNCIVPKAKK